MVTWLDAIWLVYVPFAESHFAESFCRIPLCRSIHFAEKNRQIGQGRDILPSSAKWVSANCPIFIWLKVTWVNTIGHLAYFFKLSVSGIGHGNRTFRQRRFGKKIRDVSGNFFCRNVRRHVFAETSFAETSCSPLGYVPISSSAPRPLGAAYIPILLSDVEQEQRPSGNGDREAIVVGAGLCDGEGERAYIAYIMRDVSAKFLA